MVIGIIVLIRQLLFAKIQQNVEILCRNENFNFFQFIQHDPTPYNMANRDNDDGKNGRQNKPFNIDSKAFDDDFSIDDDMFINPSQKKKQGDSYFHAITLQITNIGIRKN